MSYIEKEKLIKADLLSIENKVRHAFNQGYDLGYKEGKSSYISLDAYNQIINQRNDAIDKLLKLSSELNKIKSIVKDWNYNTWSDYISYDCMIKITAIIDEIESEKTNDDIH